MSLTFYILMVGPEGRLDDIHMMLESQILKHLPAEHHKFLKFSPEIVHRPFILTGRETPERLESSGESQIVTGLVNVSGDPTQIVVASQDASVRFNLPFSEILRQDSALAPKKLRVEVHGSFHLGTAGQCGDAWKDDTRAERVARVERSDAGIRVLLFNDPAEMSMRPAKTVFFVRVDVYAEGLGLSPDAAWVDQWGYNADREAEHITKPPPMFPTLNLPLLVDALKDLTAVGYKQERLASIPVVYRKN